MIRPVFVRSAHNYDMALASAESALVCKEESLTVQSQAADADINVIMKRFGVTGMLPVVDRPPLSADFAGVSDFREAMDLINKANKSFMGLAADVRARFGHDPGAFVAFCENPANLEELRKMGLANPATEVSNVVAGGASPAT